MVLYHEVGDDSHLYLLLTNTFLKQNVTVAYNKNSVTQISCCLFNSNPYFFISQLSLMPFVVAAQKMIHYLFKDFLLQSWKNWLSPSTQRPNQRCRRSWSLTSPLRALGWVGRLKKMPWTRLWSWSPSRRAQHNPESWWWLARSEV